MKKRYFDDLRDGEHLNCQPVVITREDIIDFEKNWSATIPYWWKRGKRIAFWRTGCLFTSYPLSLHSRSRRSTVRRWGRLWLIGLIIKTAVLRSWEIAEIDTFTWRPIWANNSQNFLSRSNKSSWSRSSPRSIQYIVIRVVDGDTIVIDYKGKYEKVRFLCVDTPESVHPDKKQNIPLGKAASDYTTKRLEGKYVDLEKRRKTIWKIKSYNICS